MSKTRIGVIGVGQFGKNHARAFSTLPEVELVGVVDRHEPTARAVAEQAGCAAMSDYRELLGRVDAVCVVVPTVHHFPVAREFLSHGIGVMVEKPLAFSTEEATQMVRLAEKHNAILQVGHIERFNPVWQAAEQIDFLPQAIETRRTSPYPFRSLDVSVVFDVMIHDLDLVLALAQSTVTNIEATGCRVISPSTDRADVRLTFANGCLAHCGCSRVHRETVRTLSAWDDRQTVDLDFFARKSVTTTVRGGETLRATRAFPSEMSNEAKEQLRQALFAIEATDHDRAAQPLTRELAEFVASVRTGAKPKVSGVEGLAAVQLASQIDALLAQTSTARRSA